MHTVIDPTNTMPEQTVNITEYIIFSIDAPTFEYDFLEPDTGPFFQFVPLSGQQQLLWSSHMCSDSLFFPLRGP